MARDDEGQSLSDRRNALRIIGGVAIGGVAGCLGGDDGDGDGTTTDDGTTTTGDGDGTTTADGDSDYPDLSGESLRFLTSDSSDTAQSFWSDVASEFEDATGADVTVEAGGFADEGIIQRITSLIQAGDPPEVAELGILPASGFLGDEQLVPLDDVVETVTERHGDPERAKQLLIDGTNYNVPLKSSYSTLWYRGDVNDITPDTWENFQSYVEDVDENVDGVRGTYYPTGTGLHAVINHLSYVYARGTTLCRREDGEVRSNLENDREAWVDVLEYARMLSEHSPVGTDSNFNAMIQAIHTEAAASNTYIGVRPKNHSIDNEKEFAAEVSPVLGMPDHPDAPDPKQTVVGGGSFVAFEGANTEAAKEWMKFVLEPERYVELFGIYAPVHYTAPWPSLKERDDYWEGLREAAAPEWSDEQIERVQYEIPEETELTNLVNEIDPPNPYVGAINGENFIETLFQRVIVQDQEIESVLDDMHQQLNGILDEAQG